MEPMTGADPELLLHYRGQRLLLYNRMVADYVRELEIVAQMTQEQRAAYDRESEEVLANARKQLVEKWGVDQPLVHPCEVLLRLYHDYLGQPIRQH